MQLQERNDRFIMVNIIHFRTPPGANTLMKKQSFFVLGIYVKSKLFLVRSDRDLKCKYTHNQ